MTYKDSYRDALDFTCKKLGLKYYKVPKRPTCVGIKYGYDIIYLICRCCYIRYTIKSTKETKDIPTGTTASEYASTIKKILEYFINTIDVVENMSDEFKNETDGISATNFYDNPDFNIPDECNDI